ncbi:MAG: lamin tail domain-containing protein, partial [Pseudomonadota bacterium]
MMKSRVLPNPSTRNNHLSANAQQPKRQSAIGVCSLLAIGLAGAAQAQLLSESFETAGLGTRYTASSVFNDGVNDHFNRTDGSDIANVSGPYSGFDGTFFWATEDTDDNGGDGQDEKTLTFNPVSVTGLTSVTFSGLFGAGSELPVDGGDYDNADFARIEASFDSGAFEPVLCFGSEVGSDAFNDPLGEDDNCDGDADGLRLGTALQAFSREITVPVAATSLTLRVRVSFDSADEEFAFDLIELNAGSAPPSIVINEILQNPSAVGDSAGEWVELFNPSSTPIDINGWTVRDDGIDSHVINNGGPLVVPGGGYLLLGNNTDTASNGGAPVDYSYGSSFFLSNSADEFIVEDDSGTEI